MTKIQNKKYIDGLKKRDNRIKYYDAGMFCYLRKHKNNSVMLTSRGKADKFFTNESDLYITPANLKRKRQGEKIDKIIKRLDGLNFEARRRYYIHVYRESGFIQKMLQKKYASFREYSLALAHDPASKISVVKMWNISIAASILLGMFSMTMIYRYLGQTVSAKIDENKTAIEYQIDAQNEVEKNQIEKNKTEENMRQISENNSVIDIETINAILSQKNEQSSLEDDIRQMVKGYPIEDMVPYIAKYDRTTAAFIVGIAKKESGWGVHVPVFKGEDCYNYWGYRGIRDKMGTGGHTCFDNPEDAVDTVAKRIEFLVSEEKLDTPKKMVIWKCGSDCSATGGRAAANQWINDISFYFNKLNNNLKDSDN